MRRCGRATDGARSASRSSAAIASGLRACCLWWKTSQKSASPSLRDGSDGALVRSIGRAGRCRGAERIDSVSRSYRGNAGFSPLRSGGRDGGGFKFSDGTGVRTTLDSVNTPRFALARSPAVCGPALPAGTPGEVR
jgi:hypothetical protein